MANNESVSIKKYLVRDTHGNRKKAGAFSVVGDVTVDVENGVGTPQVIPTYQNAVLNLLFKNIRGNGIASMEVISESTEDNGENVYRLTTDLGDHVDLTIKNGSRGPIGETGNGIESVEVESSEYDDEYNTITINFTEGEPFQFRVKNGATGSPGQSAIYDPSTGNISTMEQTLGDSAVNPMSQDAISKEFAADREAISVLKDDIDTDVWHNSKEVNGETVYEDKYYDAHASYLTTNLIAVMQQTPTFPNDLVFNQVVFGPFQRNYGSASDSINFRICIKGSGDALNVAGGGTLIKEGTLTMTKSYATKTVTLDEEVTLHAGERVCVYIYRKSSNKTPKVYIAHNPDSVLTRFNENTLPMAYITDGGSAITSANELTIEYTITTQQHQYCPSPVLRLIRGSRVRRLAVEEIESKAPGIVRPIVAEQLTAALPSITAAVQEAVGEVKVWLPKKLYAVVGDALQLFFTGIVQAPDIHQYDIVVDCSVGMVFPRYYELIPAVGDIGNKTLTVTVKNKDGNTVGSATTTIQVVAEPTSPSQTKKIAIIGASNITHGETAGELLRRLTAASSNKVNGIGGCGLSNIEVNYVGKSGWAFSTYMASPTKKYRLQVTSGGASKNAVYAISGRQYTVKEVNLNGAGNILVEGNSTNPPTSGTLTKVSGNGDSSIVYDGMTVETDNPLWDSTNNKFSFVPWITANGGGVDVLYVALNLNDCHPWQEFSASDTTGHMKDLKDFINTFNEEYPYAQVRLLTFSIPSQDGGLGANYYAGPDTDAYGLAKTVWNQNEAYEDLAEDGSYSSWLKIVDLTTQFDCEYNYPKSFRAANRRRQNSSAYSDVNDRYKVYYDTNGLHPDTPGYYQWADAIWRNFVAEFCQPNDEQE